MMKTKSVATVSEVAKVLRESNCVAIYTHINTDCDAMGSSLALREILQSQNKNISVFIDSNFPNNFKFYGDLSFINRKNCEKFDLAVCLDSVNESRLGKFKYTFKKGGVKTLCIDHHHLANEGFCDINYVKQSSSTAEILFEIFEYMNVKMSPSICKNLLSGILTDTGKFAHSTSCRTFEVCSKLLKIGGFKVEDVYYPLFNSMTFGVYQMMKKAYQKTEFFYDKKLALLIFRVEDFKETQTTMDELDAFADLPLQLECVKLAILASEDDRGFFRVSIRTKGNLSAKSVAEVFGGSGHLNASGCKIFGEYDETKQKLIDSASATFGWKND